MFANTHLYKLLRAQKFSKIKKKRKKKISSKILELDHRSLDRSLNGRI